LTPIHQDDFNIAERLLHNTAQQATDVLFFVVAADDDGC
jgi:hypothetical protein